MTENNNDNEEPRIIVDDDYKSRVEKEKEQLREEMENDDSSSGEDMQMPPASFAFLVTNMATQALANLGHMPDPVEGKPVIRKSLAKHFIDTIAMMEEKTKGNLTDEENEMIGGTLHQLRMLYVAAPDSMPSQEDGDNQASSIELPS